MWLQAFQGNPNYDDMLAGVVRQTAQVDPDGAARLVPAMPAELQRSVAPSIANGMARTDLATAARWAMEVEDEEARTAAVQQIATGWAARDPRGAQSWAVGLPRGETRDRVLSAVLNRLSRNGFHVTIEERLLDAFDSAEMRDQQLARLATAVARDDAELARRWLRRIENPELRQNSERMLEIRRTLDP